MKTKVVTKNTSDFLRYLVNNNKPYFTSQEAENYFVNSSRAYIQSFLQALVERQLIFRLKKGLYMIIPYYLMEKEFFPNSYLTAKALAGTNDYYLGYCSALQIHGLIENPSLKQHIALKNQMTPNFIEIKGMEYQLISHKKKLFYGFETIWIEYLNHMYKVRCSDFEKTILDIVNRPKYVGGIQVTAKAILEAKNRVDFSKLLDYIKQSNSQAVVKRLGYLLDTLQIETSITSELQSLLSPSYIPLDPSKERKGKTNSKWNIQINSSLKI
ncbi:MAG: transcriptional regulator [Flavobacteriaceae bacterium]|nr:transcriptional regulator [Flavobacteriaceae bacterium]MCY4216935.1 transcriptional regulator [Flavobacteriaceae bacterium]MCY4253538.1 transcriptional regulator [Flavobacteriaceae bacterium]